MFPEKKKTGLSIPAELNAALDQWRKDATRNGPGPSKWEAAAAGILMFLEADAEQKAAYLGRVRFDMPVKRAQDAAAAREDVAQVDVAIDAGDGVAEQAQPDSRRRRRPARRSQVG